MRYEITETQDGTWDVRFEHGCTCNYPSLQLAFAEIAAELGEYELEDLLADR